MKNKKCKNCIWFDNHDKNYSPLCRLHFLALYQNEMACKDFEKLPKKNINLRTLLNWIFGVGGSTR